MNNKNENNDAKFYWSTILILSISCKPTENVSSQSNSPTFEVDPSITNLIDEVTANFPTGTEIAIAFISKDSTSFYGAKNIESEVKQQQNQFSLFEIGSISKVFTSDLLAQMHLSGKLIHDKQEVMPLWFCFSQTKRNPLLSYQT